MWSHYYGVDLMYNENKVITPVVIKCSLTTMVLASCIMEMGRRLPVVIECGLTTVVLASCIMKTG